MPVKKKISVMAELLQDAPLYTLPKPGTIVDGTVIDIQKNKILIDLDGVSTGVVSGQEAVDSRGSSKDIKIGDRISAFVLEEENDAGLVVLSLRKASQKKTWNHFVSAHESNESITVVASEANKGGLLINVDGIKGFIPVSQLAPMHYPRVDGADSAEILKRLQKLVGIPLLVRIINLDKEGGKLILSEKAAEEETRDAYMETLDIGQKMKGRVSGIVKFGIFVTFNGVEGLVHISEIAWGHVRDPRDFGRVGDEVEVLIIGKERDKISLSMKRLTPDPWLEATKKYKVGTTIESEITRVTPFGAFVKLDEEINGLIHVSEIVDGDNVDPTEHLKVGQKVQARIIAIEPEEHRVALTLKPEKEAKKAKKEKTEEKEEVAEEKEEKKTAKKKAAKASTEE